MLKTCLSAFLAMVLLGCQAQRNTQQTPTACLAARALGGCEAFAQPAPFATATISGSATPSRLVLNKLVAAPLHEVSEVKFALDPGKGQRPGQRGGLIALAARG